MERISKVLEEQEANRIFEIVACHSFLRNKNSKYDSSISNLSMIRNWRYIYDEWYSLDLQYNNRYIGHFHFYTPGWLPKLFGVKSRVTYISSIEINCLDYSIFEPLFEKVLADKAEWDKQNNYEIQEYLSKTKCK